MRRLFNEWFDNKKKNAEPEKQPKPVFTSKQAKEEYDPYLAACMPPDFHERVVELELRCETHKAGEDAQTIKNYQELMGLYSVSYFR